MELHLPPKPTPTVLPGEFRFAAAGLAHGHIYGMVNGLLDAGAELVGVWDEDLKKVSAFQSAFPQAHAASCLDELLDDRQRRGSQRTLSAGASRHGGRQGLLC